MPTHYEVLGVADGATDDEIRRAYRRLAKSAHPDRLGDATRFRQITEAYGVLSDPRRRNAYDRALNPGVPPPRLPPARRPRNRRYGAALAVALVAGFVVWLVPSPSRPSLGDDCLVGTWRSEPFEVPFRAFLDGREVVAAIGGGAGATLAVGADGTVRGDYRSSSPLTGTSGADRIEGAYVGTTVERWRAAGGQVRQSGTDASALEFRATINGRLPDQPLAVTLVDRDVPYTCSPAALVLGPYRYTRA